MGLRVLCHCNPVLGSLVGSQPQGGPDTCARAAGVGRDQGEILACIYMTGDSNQIETDSHSQGEQGCDSSGCTKSHMTAHAYTHCEAGPGKSPFVGEWC